MRGVELMTEGDCAVQAAHKGRVRGLRRSACAQLLCLALLGSRRRKISWHAAAAAGAGRILAPAASHCSSSMPVLHW